MQFALRHYHFPEFIRQLIRSYCDFLRIVVDVPTCFRTKPIHFAIGVFQGCTLSLVLFNIVIQLALDMLEQRMHQSFAYQLACNPQMTLLTSAYADDILLVSKLPGRKPMFSGHLRPLSTLVRNIGSTT